MTEEEIQKITLFMERFLEHITTERYSSLTVQGYRQHLNVFREFLRGQDEESLTSITGETLYRYQIHVYTSRWKGKPLSLNTQCGRLVAVRSFFRYLAKRGNILSDPAGGLELPRQKRGLPRGVMTRREVEKILKAPDMDKPLGLRDKAILEVLYSTGIRHAELINLTVPDVDLVERELCIRNGKGGRDRVVPLGELATSYVAQYIKKVRPALTAKRPESAPNLFLTRNGRPFLPCMTNTIVVQRYAREAGISKHITPHSFRHTCATHMLQGRASIRHIQALLGHKSLETTQIYTQVAIGDLKREHRRTHPREQAKG